jgi:hypothetical protein
MGAGILPTCIHNGKLYFLFGKENKYNDTPGWSDFGGGTEKNESYLDTAIREGTEELTGFLGSKKELADKLRNGNYSLDLLYAKNAKPYRMHLFHIPYDEKLPFYYNNNQKFLQKNLDPEVIKKTKIFEKAEIRWISIDELPRMKNKMRYFFKGVVDLLIDNQNDIIKFIKSVR